MLHPEDQIAEDGADPIGFPLEELRPARIVINQGDGSVVRLEIATVTFSRYSSVVGVPLASSLEDIVSPSFAGVGLPIIANVSRNRR